MRTGWQKSVRVDEPGRDSYRLTAKGKSLRPVLTAIANWGLSNIKGTVANLDAEVRLNVSWSPDGQIIQTVIDFSTHELGK